MLKTEKNIEINEDYMLLKLGRPEDIIFFDIETTGLSMYKSQLYLIGLLTYDESNACWKLIQYLCEEVSDELPVLEDFFKLLSSKKILISFNGDGFDIPFLSTMAHQYGISSDFSAIESFDILKKIRPLKSLLGMPDQKLKTCERFLGIGREDIFSGAELIYMYLDWQRDHDPEKLRCLLLHNDEDIENLPHVLPLLSYLYMLENPLHVERQEIKTYQDGSKTLFLYYHSEETVPVPIHYEEGRADLYFEKNQIILSIELFEGECKLFFPDYQNYYYLPVEDTAIHKSLADFMDAKYRVKATARTAYQRVNGLFVPEKADIFTPVLKKEYKGKISYVPYQAALFIDDKSSGAYLRSLLPTSLVHLCRNRQEGLQ